MDTHLPTHYRTVVVSDLHLGIRDSKAKEVVRFLRAIRCETLILNGDIIDGWQLKRSGKWKKRHSRFFKHMLRMVDQEQTKVIYCRGNHDDFLDEILPFEIGNFSIVRDTIIESAGRKYYVVHGDIFDSVTTNLKWVAKLGDIGYNLLLWVNHLYNARRTRQGLPYYSLSQKIKARVKGAVSFVDDFEKTLAEVARQKGCAGIITGHIHTAADKMIGDVHYLNSGDWVESLTALVETHEGVWSVLSYHDWVVTQNHGRGVYSPIANQKETLVEPVAVPNASKDVFEPHSEKKEESFIPKVENSFSSNQTANAIPAVGEEVLGCA